MKSTATISKKCESPWKNSFVFQKSLFLIANPPGFSRKRLNGKKQCSCSCLIKLVWCSWCVNIQRNDMLSEDFVSIMAAACCWLWTLISPPDPVAGTLCWLHFLDGWAFSRKPCMLQVACFSSFSCTALSRNCHLVPANHILSEHSCLKWGQAFHEAKTVDVYSMCCRGRTAHQLRWKIINNYVKHSPMTST